MEKERREAHLRFREGVSESLFGQNSRTKKRCNFSLRRFHADDRSHPPSRSRLDPAAEFAAAIFRKHWARTRAHRTDGRNWCAVRCQSHRHNEWLPKHRPKYYFLESFEIPAVRLPCAPTASFPNLNESRCSPKAVRWENASVDCR